MMSKRTENKQQKNKTAGAGEEGSWFGFSPINPRLKTVRVKQVFESVAPSYDLMNDLMSLGIHRIWKRRFVAKVAPRPNETILDVAGGTGDIAFLMHAAAPSAKITVCDINSAMLEVGRARALDRGLLKGINFSEGNAEKLPIKSSSVDVYTIAFGLRNVTDIDAALREAKRVLKPGGRFFCLEFSRVAQPLQPFYDAYSFGLLPILGRVVANDEASYRYLAESIRQFPSQTELVGRMHKAGLKDAAFTNYSGGIVAVHSGIKR
jgi:demethylmenaquinone methyltransferase / 2-methoxy-6-polyprenyl-1,4-benzoquinol methylase